MATIERDTITLHYDDTGSGAPPLLLVHGFGGNRGEWAAQVAHFSPRHRVVAIDRRGHGDSSAPTDADYGITAYADELAGVSDELGLAPAVVVVHSFDRIAIDFALRYPERTAAIVSVDGPTAAGEPFRQAALGFQQGLRSPAWREAIRGFADAMIFAPDMPAARREAVLAQRYAVPVEVLRASWDSFVAYDEEAALAQLTCAILHVKGSFPGNHERLRELCPQLRTATLTGQGHLLQVEAADALNATVERFLADALNLAELG